MKSPSACYRLLLVDDAPEVREALRYALEDEADLVVIGEAGDGLEAIARAAALAPDAVILDIELPRLDGYAVARSLKRSAAPPVIVFLSVHSAAAGGDGFAEKGAGWPTLLAELRRALAGRPPSSP
jgi:DNA-binding NarL/FixJ family response regulator